MVQLLLIILILLVQLHSDYLYECTSTVQSSCPMLFGQSLLGTIVSKMNHSCFVLALALIKKIDVAMAPVPNLIQSIPQLFSEEMLYKNFSSIFLVFFIS
jgi:hypothetical protein